MLTLLSKCLPTIQRTHVTAARLAILAGVATLLIYVAGNTVSFIVQLFDASATESAKFCKVLAALLNRPTLELEFLPQEFEDLTPDSNGVYEYAPASFHPLLFRRSGSVAGAWEWSDDGRRWFSCDSFRESANGVPEPPALLFILRLHAEHAIRRRLAHPAALSRRLPPPLDTDTPRPGRPLDAAPDVLCCPISHGLMRVPVVAPSGTTFEYEYIRKWALSHQTDPVNGAPLSEAELYPNLAVRDMVERWLQQGGRPAGTAAAAGMEGEAAGVAAAAGQTEGGVPPHLIDLS